MHAHPDILYQAAREAHGRAVQQAAEERRARLLPSRPWLDAAVWSAIVGSLIGLGFLGYFARVILSAVGG